MRVIHQHRNPLAVFNAFESTRNRLDLAKYFLNSSERNTLNHSACHSREKVVDIVSSEQIGDDFFRPKRSFQGKLATRFCERNVFSLEIRIAVNARGDGTRFKFTKKFLPDCIVNIKNSMLYPVFQEKFFLGIFVVLHIAMKIQMIAAQVGKNTRLETHVMNTALVQSVGRDFQETLFNFFFDHFIQHPV